MHILALAYCCDYKNSTSSGPAPDRLSCFMKYSLDETFDVIASTCCIHFNLFATICTPNSLNVVTRFTGVPFRVANSGGSCRIEPNSISFCLPAVHNHTRLSCLLYKFIDKWLQAYIFFFILDLPYVTKPGILFKCIHFVSQHSAAKTQKHTRKRQT